MRVKSPQKLDKGEEKYTSKLGWPAGWLAALSAAITAISVSCSS